MADENVVKLLEKLAGMLREEGLPITGLVLYGSMARGDAHQWSDIDVLALAEDSVPRSSLFDLAGKVQQRAGDLDNRVEVIAVHRSYFETNESSPIIEVARSEGILIAA